MTTDAPAATPAPTTTQTPAAPSSDAPAAAAAPAAADTPAAPANDKPADTPAPAADAPADGDKKDSGEPAAAAPAADAPKADEPKPGDQPSDGQKPDDQKDQEGKDKEGQTPQAQDYQQALSQSLPEGMEVDQESLEKATPFFQKYKLPAEAMAEVGPLVGNIISKAMKANSDAHQKIVDGWHDKTVELFGKEGEDKFTEKNAVANRAIVKYFSEEDRAMIKHYGFGNMPGLFAMAYQVGLAMGEDNSSLPSARGAEDGEDVAKIWYPNAG